LLRAALETVRGVALSDAERAGQDGAAIGTRLRERRIGALGAMMNAAR
jgi:hypothetical protein